MFVVEARYVMALLSAASSPEIADKVGEDLTAFSSLIQEDEVMRNFMLNPAISGRIKRETIGKIFTDDTPVILNNFISLLVDKGRLKLLPGICQEYRRLKAEMRNGIIIKIASSRQLDNEQLEGIRRLYVKKYGASESEIEFKLEPALLGGVRIKIGDFCIDNSLLGRIEGIRLNVAETRLNVNLA